MRRRPVALLIAVAIAFAAVAFLLFLPGAANLAAGAQSAWQEKLDPDLLAALEEQATGTLAFILHLPAQADLRPASLPRDRESRRVAVVDRLQGAAIDSQANVLSELTSLQSAGHIASYQPFWIFNGIAVSGDREALIALANRPDIARVSLDAPVFLEWDAPTPAFSDLSRGAAAAAGDGYAVWGLERIRARQTWHALGLDGTGAVVAIMDTGVDWTHPALQGGYRGFQENGGVDHAGSWFDAVDPDNPIPIDPYQHGTHVAGIAVGDEGLGVAPGAEWIAVRVFDALGYSSFSILHLGFQWLMAPDGDPALAPDVVNGSWGSPQIEDAFQDDVAALVAAGIYPVFAAGNSGNSAGTIATPGAFPTAMAVGASDEFGRLTWFSSAGPSNYTPRIKPELVAPGARVLSSLPGGAYAFASGTSMAAPHVAGAAALLLSFDPGISPPILTNILTRTARPLNGNEPNLLTGWGELDAYMAAANVVPTGRFTGIVRSNGNGLAGVTLTLTTPAGEVLTFSTNAIGQYEIAVQAGEYDLAFSAFGHQTLTLNDLSILVGEQIIGDHSLVRLPTGTVSGRVMQHSNDMPLSATVLVPGAPVSATTDADGWYELTLPAGEYDLLVAEAGYQRNFTHLEVPAGGSVAYDFRMRKSERVLLVDSGWWYYGSHAGYYREALHGLDLAYDEWRVLDPTSDAPSVSDLAPYDVVIWTAPGDSPGLIGASHVISNYLGLGGDLLISGRNIGAYDGSLLPEAWWSVAMRAVYVDRLNTVGDPPVSGAGSSPFAGLEFTLNGGDSAGNQSAVDQVAPMAGSYTAPAFQYEPGRTAGLLRGKCVRSGYHLVYLGFGLEGVSESADRQAILDASLDYFKTPPETAGLRMEPATTEDIVLAGRQVTYTLTLHNDSETLTDTFSLSTSGVPWPTHVTTPTLTLGPCESGQTRLIFDAPADLPEDTVFDFAVEVVSANAPELSAVAAFSLKTPGRILLVDDHRFLTPTSSYADALTSMGLRFDDWITGWSGEGRGSPPPALLNEFDLVVWYTGFDWLEPVSADEAEALQSYLESGGRLLLSSQDYLFYNSHRPLTTDYLGVQAYAESITPTVVLGGDNAVLGESDPARLDYGLYQNNADGIMSAPGSPIFAWHNRGGAASVASSGVGADGDPWRTVFWSLPLEKLPESHFTATVARAVGWLSDLGDSTMQVDRRSTEPGAMRHFTITLRSSADHFVVMTNTVPGALTIDPGSIVSEARLEHEGRLLIWQGTIEAGESRRISYQAQVASDAPAGIRIDNPVAIRYSPEAPVYTATATTWVAAPDLSGSFLESNPNPVRPGRRVSYHVTIRNSGTAGTISATLMLPEALTLITDTLESSAGELTFNGRFKRFSWVGELGAGDEAEISMSLRVPWQHHISYWPAKLVISDGVTAPLVRSTWLEVAPLLGYWPIFFGR